MPKMPRSSGGNRVLGGAAYDALRRQVKPSRRWYGLAAWRARRADQLAREPLCRMCAAEGAAVLATVADHVEPHREDAARFWHGELQSLCARHHSAAKQSAERGGR